MIRRDDRGDWLVIVQVEHARLAGELARVWGNDRVASLAAFPTLVWGVEHHDDGWQEWDDAPRLNPATGFHAAFWRCGCALDGIWSRSIAVCSADPLAGIAVSRHFCHWRTRPKTAAGQTPTIGNRSIDFSVSRRAVQARLWTQPAPRTRQREPTGMSSKAAISASARSVFSTW